MFFHWKNYLNTLLLLTDQSVDKVNQEGIIYRKYIYFTLPPSLSTMIMFTESEFD